MGQAFDQMDNLLGEFYASAFARPAVQMPRYRCHKNVSALKILEVQEAGILIVEVPYAPLSVTPEYMQRHRPQPGGYYVVYDDGYASFSPAKAFEDGYTKL